MIKRIYIVGWCQTKEPGGILGYTITSCKNSSKPLLVPLTFFLSQVMHFWQEKKALKLKAKASWMPIFCLRWVFRWHCTSSLPWRRYSPYSPHTIVWAHRLKIMKENKDCHPCFFHPPARLRSKNVLRSNAVIFCRMYLNSLGLALLALFNHEWKSEKHISFCLQVF